MATWRSRVEAGQETEDHSDEYAKADQRTGMLKPPFMMEKGEHAKSRRRPEKEGISWERASQKSKEVMISKEGMSTI